MAKPNITPDGHITFREAEHIVAKGTCFRKCLLLSIGYEKDGFAVLTEGFEPLKYSEVCADGASDAVPYGTVMLLPAVAVM